jgi:hypothetical protein
MLLKLIWNFVLPFALVFALIVGVPLLRPYNPAPLLALIAPPENCAAPCWGGIRPGATRLDDAVSTLRATGFIEDLNIDLDQETDSGVVQWRWNGAQPHWIDERIAGRMTVSGGLITDISFATQLTLGDFRLSFGAPDSVSAGGFGGGVPTAQLNYAALGIRLSRSTERGTGWVFPVYYTLYGNAPMG